MDENIIFPEIEGIDWESGKEHFAGMDDMLLSTAKQYYMTLLECMEKIRNAYVDIETEAGLNTYRIETHSVKSTSALIGANAVSELAKMCEYAAKASDYGTIHATTPTLMKRMAALHEAMNAVFASQGTTGTKPVDNAEIRELSAIIRKAMSEMDIDVVDEKVAELADYQFDEEMRAVMDQLQTATMNLDIEKTNELLSRMDSKFV